MDLLDAFLDVCYFLGMAPVRCKSCEVGASLALIEEVSVCSATIEDLEEVDLELRVMST